MTKLVIASNASGTGTITINAPNTSTSTAYTLPSADGTSGQAIITNGSGTLSFGNVGISTGKSIAMAMIFGF